MSNFQGHVETIVHEGQHDSPLLRLFGVLYRQPFSDVMMYHVPYRVSVLLVCSLVATAVLTWLFKQPNRSPAVADGSAADNPRLDNRSENGGAFELGLSPAKLGALASKRRDATS
jgi:hypothetical protein